MTGRSMLQGGGRRGQGAHGRNWYRKKSCLCAAASVALLWPAGASAHSLVEFLVPTAGSCPYVITPGPGGALWFTERDGGKIGRITTAGVITEFPVPTAGSQPTVIAAGPDGVWAVETPYLPIEATGCGDAVAALFLGWLLKGRSVPEALGP